MEKKTYVEPKLINLGSVSMKTQSHADGPSSDSGTNQMGS